MVCVYFASEIVLRHSFLYDPVDSLSPGRFFAANEMKLIMAQLILMYDIKMKNEGVRPENTWSGFACRPNITAEVLFRRRRT